MRTSLNWDSGWWLILAGGATGAVLGLFFHRDDFLGGYASFRRRLLRLGHIALMALGMLNLLFALGPCESRWASWLLVTGGITMPVVCFLTAWRKPCRHLFVFPVLAIGAAIVLTISGGAK